jgi:patatin-like phospholipase/acyl hydrolase
MTITTTNDGLNDEPSGIYRVLSLDGGGAKGFYTLGVLKEVEAMFNARLCDKFDLVFGTSTGAIIASLIALGYEIDEIHDLYKKHVPTVMSQKSPSERSRALKKLTTEVFGTKTFEDVKTGVGVVATRWATERPMIFKGSVNQAHGMKDTFVPGFGVRIAEAVEASCSAYPFFNRKSVTTASGDIIELIDGGYCANNPTLYALADAVAALKKAPENIRVLNVGVGVYPEPKAQFMMRLAKKYLVSVQLLQKTLEINTQSMDQLRSVLFKNISTIRISEVFERPEMATDLLEHNLQKLNLLRQKGRDSFGSFETRIRSLLM